MLKRTAFLCCALAGAFSVAVVSFGDTRRNAVT